jgi:hypothetical protein
MTTKSQQRRTCYQRPRRAARLQLVGLVIHFHQQSHQQLPQDHAKSDLGA